MSPGCHFIKCFNNLVVKRVYGLNAHISIVLLLNFFYSYLGYKRLKMSELTVFRLVSKILKHDFE